MTDSLTIRLEDRYTHAMDHLRARGWEHPIAGSARDAFDDASWHVVARVGRRPVGMVRLTPGNTSVLQHWCGRMAPLPAASDVIELTRGVVDRQLRGFGLYRLLMLETMLRVHGLGGTTVTAAVEPGFFARRFLREVGFEDVGAPIIFEDAPRAATLAQCILVRVSPEHEASWRVMWLKQAAAVAARGCTLHSEIDGGASPQPTGSVSPLGRLLGQPPQPFDY